MERNVVSLDDIKSRLVSEHLKPYYDWIRLVISLSTVSLTVLVSLQSHYIPKEPKWVWLLAACWMSLVVSVASGLLALSGEYQTPLDAAQDLIQRRIDHGDAATAAALMRNFGFRPRFIFKCARRVMVYAFLSGVLSIALFAVRNLPL